MRAGGASVFVGGMYIDGFSQFRLAGQWGMEIKNAP